MVMMYRQKLSAIWTLEYTLTTALKLLHPYMPFVTEEIYTSLLDLLKGEMADSDRSESIMISKWPSASDEFKFDREESQVELIKAAVKSVRDIRTSLNVPRHREKAR